MRNFSPMYLETNTFTRREALLSVLQGTVAFSLAAPFITTVAAETTSVPAPEFVPENDYPFFGCEPESHG